MIYRNSFDFYGFTVKYCIPNNFIGKFVRKAKIYYNSDFVCEYNYDLKTKSISLTYPSVEIELLLNDLLEIISKTYHTPREILPFLFRLFDYLEIYNHKELAKKKNEDGIFVVLDNNLKFKHVIAVEKYSLELNSKIKNKFKNFNCYFIDANIENFNVEDLFKFKFS